MKTALITFALVISGISAFAATNTAASTVMVAGQAIVADRAGLTVYTFDPDKNGVSSCYDGCAQEWPPVLLTAADTVAAPFGFTVRNDGSHQLTLNKKPLYLFDEDKVSGDIKGDGDDGIWHIVPAPAN